MNKIVLLENTAVLKNRIENIICNTGHHHVESYNNRSFSIKKNEAVFEGCNLLIVDLDNIKVTVELFLKDIRQNNSSKDMPVVLVTTHPTHELVLQAAKYKKVEILAKPFTDVKLLEKTLWDSQSPTLEQVKTENNNRNDDKNSENIVKFTWNDDYKIGIEEIDDEHKLIIDHFEKLYQLMSEGKGHEYYKELLTFLESYIDTHFSHEEAYHQKIKYPVREDHKKLHLIFTDKIRNIVEVYNEAEVTNSELIHINIFIKQWLLHHILVEDKKVSNFVYQDD